MEAKPQGDREWVKTLLVYLILNFNSRSKSFSQEYKFQKEFQFEIKTIIPLAYDIVSNLQKNMCYI